MENYIWTKVGMSMWEWRELPKEKKLEIGKSLGYKIGKACEGKPPFSGSYLLDAYFKHNAEDFTIHWNYPNACLSCGH
jgi:hypothetical protein